MSKSDRKNDFDPTRRRLLTGITGAGALGLGVAAGACRPSWTPPEDDATGVARAKPYVPGAEQFDTNEERWTVTSCAQCPAGCGLRVRVVEGRAVRIEGNPSNPVNEGGVGPRGLASLQALYDPDRLSSPRVRNASGQLEPASWEDAMARVSKELGELRAKGQADRLVVMSGHERGFTNDLLGRFCAAYGTPNFVDGRPGHTGALAQALEASLGVYETPAYDWSQTRYVLSLEAGLFESSCQAVFLARIATEMRRGREGRAKLVHVGPRYNLSAYNADSWIKVRPGTSGAFALGLCRYALRSDLRHDLLFAESMGDGLEAFKEMVAAYTPERVQEITGAPAELVPRTAEQMWRARPSFAFIDERSVGFSNGLDTARAAYSLNALLGAVESSTGGLRLPAAAPVGQWPPITIDESAKKTASKPRLDQAGSSAYPKARSVYAPLLAAMQSDSPPQAVLLYHGNPCFARPQPARWREALAKVPLVVSFSPYLDETTAEVADVVLPDHSFLERYEDASPAPSVPRAVIGVRQPAVTPLLNTRQTGDVVIDLAKALGGSMAPAFPWGNFREAMESRLLGLHALRRGTVRGDSEREFIAKLYDQGSWAEQAEAPPRAVRFAFPSTWTEPSWRGDAATYPLKLLVYRPLGYAEGGGSNLPWLRTLRAMPGAHHWRSYATIHPSSAPSGVSDGGLVEVDSEWGSLEFAVRFDARMETETIAIPRGGGHTHFGRAAVRAGGANPMTLLAPDAAQETGADVASGTRVRLRKAGSHA